MRFATLLGLTLLCGCCKPPPAATTPAPAAPAEKQKQQDADAYTIKLHLDDPEPTQLTAIPNELLGKWHGGGQGPDGPNGEPGLGWSADYELRADGTYTMTGYPQITVNGKLEVPERIGNRFHVRLTQRMADGSLWGDYDEWVVLDAAGVLHLEGKELRR
ncbi:MAG: hypothetical protein IT370_20465 [Deltaproteobacteria bacterium]|nr:hypothetical protein [Deltaproteobacteria bacterium]